MRIFCQSFQIALLSSLLCLVFFISPNASRLEIPWFKGEWVRDGRWGALRISSSDSSDGGWSYRIVLITRECVTNTMILITSISKQNLQTTQPPMQTFLGVRHAFLLLVGEERLRDEPVRTSAWEATNHCYYCYFFSASTGLWHRFAIRNSRLR